MTIRLNNTLREAFVRAVIDDIPLPEDEVCEKEFREILFKHMPTEVQAVYKLCPEWLAPARWGAYADISVGKEWRNHHIQVNYNWHSYESDTLPSEANEYLKKLEDQADKVREFKMKLLGIVKGCTTVDQLKKMLPELEEYMPKEPEKIKDLPVCSNLMADAVKLGWPKGKKPTT